MDLPAPANGRQPLLPHPQQPPQRKRGRRGRCLVTGGCQSCRRPLRGCPRRRPCELPRARERPLTMPSRDGQTPPTLTPAGWTATGWSPQPWRPHEQAKGVVTPATLAPPPPPPLTSIPVTAVTERAQTQPTTAVVAQQSPSVEPAGELLPCAPSVVVTTPPPGSLPQTKATTLPTRPLPVVTSRVESGRAKSVPGGNGQVAARRGAGCGATKHWKLQRDTTPAPLGILQPPTVVARPSRRPPRLPHVAAVGRARAPRPLPLPRRRQLPGTGAGAMAAPPRVRHQQPPRRRRQQPPAWPPWPPLLGSWPTRRPTTPPQARDRASVRRSAAPTGTPHRRCRRRRRCPPPLGHPPRRRHGLGDGGGRYRRPPPPRAVRVGG